MAQEAQVQHTTPTEAATHPPGTMTPKLNASKGKKDLKDAVVWGAELNSTSRRDVGGELTKAMLLVCCNLLIATRGWTYKRTLEKLVGGNAIMPPSAESSSLSWI